MHTHRTLLHGVMRRTRGFRIGPDDRLTLFSSGTTQALMNILSALLNGASLHPLPLKQAGINQLASWLRQEEITIYHAASPLFRHFISTLTGKETFPRLRLVRLASDTVHPLDVELYRAHFGPECLLVNGLSTTETGTTCLYFMDKSTPVSRENVPVGYALEGMEILVLDADGIERDEGEGEIAIRSQYLSPGYWGRPELTRAAFVPDPRGSDARVYRTGDVGRLHPDGCLEHLGRRGSRVQIRGYSVEISEVETALRALEEVREAVVVPRDEPQGHTELIAYVVPATVPATPRTLLRRSLAALLPDYMVPAAFVLLEALPMTANGKVDRRALSALEPTPLELGTPYVAPRTDIEARLALLWSEILGIERVGIHDDFFTLGGHSLLAMQLLVRVRETCHVDIPLATLVNSPTIAALAHAIEEPDGQSLSPVLLAYKPYGTRPPFFCVHGVELLARHMEADQPFYALHPHGLDGERAPDTVEEMATDYVRAVQASQPQGPYFLGGYSFGGLIAFAMAHQLLAQGQQVALLILLDSGGPNEGRAEQDTLRGRGVDVCRVLLARACNLYLREGRRLPLGLRLTYFLGMARRAARGYDPRPYPGRLVLLRAIDNPRDPHKRWGGMSTDGLDIYDIPGNHATMLTEPRVQQVAAQITRLLRQHQDAWAPKAG